MEIVKFVVVYSNTIKTTFYFNFDHFQMHKHVNKEKLSMNSFSLFTFKPVIWKMIIRD